MPDEHSFHQEAAERAEQNTRANSARIAPLDDAEKVELAVGLLNELRCVQDELERHVRLYLEAGERLVLCTKVLRTLRKKALSDDDWETISDNLDAVEALTGTEALKEADPKLVRIASEFDDEREDANRELQAALNPTQGVDLDTVQDKLFNNVWNMSRAAGQLTQSCRSGAESWLNRIGKSLSALFGRIDQQLEARKGVTTTARSTSTAYEPGDEAAANEGTHPAAASKSTAQRAEAWKGGS
jgi:hypothetical protein